MTNFDNNLDLESKAKSLIAKYLKIEMDSNRSKFFDLYASNEDGRTFGFYINYLDKRRKISMTDVGQFKKKRELYENRSGTNIDFAILLTIQPASDLMKDVFINNNIYLMSVDELDNFLREYTFKKISYRKDSFNISGKSLILLTSNRTRDFIKNFVVPILLRKELRLIVPPQDYNVSFKVFKETLNRGDFVIFDITYLQEESSLAIEIGLAMSTDIPLIFISQNLVTDQDILFNFPVTYYEESSNQAEILVQRLLRAMEDTL